MKKIKLKSDFKFAYQLDQHIWNVFLCSERILPHTALEVSFSAHLARAEIRSEILNFITLLV